MQVDSVQARVSEKILSSGACDWERIGQSLSQLDQFLVARFLHDELKRRRERNQKYSQRAMARDLGLSSGDLSKVMRGIKFLSAETVERLAMSLHLPPELSRVLIVSAAMRRLKSGPDSLHITSSNSTQTGEVSSGF